MVDTQGKVGAELRGSKQGGLRIEQKVGDHALTAQGTTRRRGDFLVPTPYVQERIKDFTDQVNTVIAGARDGLGDRKGAAKLRKCFRSLASQAKRDLGE